MNSTDEWKKGTLDKSGIWTYYIAANYLGVILCIFFLVSIKKMSKRTAQDIFVGGLLTGCIEMSATCGTQCLLSVIHDYFWGGPLACELEAFFHVSAILVQFFCVTAIGVRGVLQVRFGINIPNNIALLIVGLIWIVCIVVTYMLSFWSPIYLMSAGTYCFFQFASPAILWWMILMLCVAFLTLCISYTIIVVTAVRIRADAPIAIDSADHHRGNTLRFALRLSIRSLVFVAVLYIGWGFAAITAIYEYVNGEATEMLVTAVGVGGVTHSVMVPIAYGLSDQYHRAVTRRVLCRCLPCRGVRWRTMVTAVSSDVNASVPISGQKDKSQQDSQGSPESKVSIMKKPIQGFTTAVATPTRVHSSRTSSGGVNRLGTPSGGARYVMPMPPTSYSNIALKLPT